MSLPRAELLAQIPSGLEDGDVIPSPDLSPALPELVDIRNERYFSTRMHTYTVYGLTALVRDSQQPVCATYLRHLEIYFPPVQLLDVDSYIATHGLE